MKLFIFVEQTAYGIAVRGIVASSIEKAFEYENSNRKSLKDLGWDINSLVYSCDSSEC